VALSASVSYHIDGDCGVVFLTYGTKQPTPAEWLDVMDEILASPAFHPGMAFVSDRRLLQEAPTTAMIRVMAAYEREHRAAFGTCRWAVVTPADKPAEFGMARMSQTVLAGEQSPIELRPFTDLDQAIRWATTGTPEP